MQKSLVLLALFYITGCGDCLASRRVTFVQRATLDTPSQHFVIDSSQLPRDWVERQWVAKDCYGEAQFIQVHGNVPIRIVLIPDDGANNKIDKAQGKPVTP